MNEKVAQGNLSCYNIINKSIEVSIVINHIGGICNENSMGSYSI